MRFQKFSIYDAKCYAKKRLAIYITFVVLFLIGILFGVINGLASDNYLKFLTKENKVLINFINGTAATSKIFWNKLSLFILPLIIIFSLGFNIYLSLLSFIYIAYQGAILTLSIFAIISTYGVSGVLNVLFITIPINLIYIAILIIFSTACFERAKAVQKNKMLFYGIKDHEFVAVITACVVAVLLLCIIGAILLPIFLKNAIFIIF